MSAYPPYARSSSVTDHIARRTRQKKGNDRNEVPRVGLVGWVWSCRTADIQVSTTRMRSGHLDWAGRELAKSVVLVRATHSRDAVAVTGSARNDKRNGNTVAARPTVA